MIYAQIILKEVSSIPHTIQNLTGGVYLPARASQWRAGPHPHKCLNLDSNFSLRSALCAMRFASLSLSAPPIPS
jgi:hypothetical protein